MACKLTYKRQRFDSIQELQDFLNNELINSSAMPDITGKASAFQAVQNSNVEIQELYKPQEENDVFNKFDSCRI